MGGMCAVRASLPVDRSRVADRRADIDVRGAIRSRPIGSAIVAPGGILIVAPKKRLVIPDGPFAAGRWKTDGLNEGGGSRGRAAGGEEAHAGGEDEKTSSERVKTHDAYSVTPKLERNLLTRGAMPRHETHGALPWAATSSRLRVGDTSTGCGNEQAGIVPTARRTGETSSSFRLRMGLASRGGCGRFNERHMQ